MSDSVGWQMANILQPVSGCWPCCDKIRRFRDWEGSSEVIHVILVSESTWHKCKVLSVKAK